MSAKAVLKKMKGAPIAMKKNVMKKEEIVSRRPTVLRFSPTAWAKLLFLRDAGDTEIGGFGISAQEDLLLIEAIELVAQSCTWSHVAFDDEAVADLFDRQIAAGRKPAEFARIWIHTHPGRSPEPSGTDEATFARVFGRSDWALMFILARGGQSYARLRFNLGPGADILLPVDVDYGCPFAGSDSDAWQAEYRANVRVPPPVVKTIVSAVHKKSAVDEQVLDDGWRDAWEEYADFDRKLEEAEYGYIRDF
jgi:proteasome lid subunit RPN8/RPN11